MRALLMVLVVSACGQTSYRSATTARPMGNDRYLITVRGNSRMTSDAVLEYVDRKARELCPSGYDVEQTSGGVENHAYTNQGTGQVYNVRRVDSSTIVQCR